MACYGKVKMQNYLILLTEPYKKKHIETEEVNNCAKTVSVVCRYRSQYILVTNFLKKIFCSIEHFSGLD